MNLYERYLNGEQKLVFNKIQKLGEEAFEKNNFIEIDRILNHFFRGVKTNLNIIFSELNQRNYLFKKEFKYNSDKPLCDPLPNTDELLFKLDQAVKPFGHIPLSLKYFYKIVGSVNFAWDYQANENIMWQLSDPIQIISLDDLVKLVSEDYWQEEIQEYVNDKEFGNAFLELSADYYHKDNISGGAPYSILINEKQTIDNQFINEPHQNTFINYLRICINSCGFSRVPLSSQDEYQLFKDIVKPKLQHI